MSRRGKTFIVPITVETFDGYGVVALARLKVGQHVVRYADGSRYEDRLVEHLEKELAVTLKKAFMDLGTTDIDDQARIQQMWEEEVF